MGKRRKEGGVMLVYEKSCGSRGKRKKKEIVRKDNFYPKEKWEKGKEGSNFHSQKEGGELEKKSELRILLLEGKGGVEEDFLMKIDKEGNKGGFEEGLAFLKLGLRGKNSTLISGREREAEKSQEGEVTWEGRGRNLCLLRSRGSKPDGGTSLTEELGQGT